MPVGTLAEAQEIAHDVAAVLDGIAAVVNADADRALAAMKRDLSIELRQRAEELARQAGRLRSI
jgi:hypothetical protein